jgi:4-hydroxy 2-oxovalerate aldolase
MDNNGSDMATKQVKLLDCTLRDGGYYNAWDFDYTLISEYLKAMASLPADMVELGFRLMPMADGKFNGGCAYCSDSFIRTLNLPEEELKLAVMVNGADLVAFPNGVQAAINYLFGVADHSPVELVRIACHVNKVEETLPAITQLNKLGYKTTVNLMQIAGLTESELEKLAAICAKYPIDILYFADSLGGMMPDDIDKTVDSLRSYWDGELGFHGHNNMELALPNSIRAIDKGVTWIDSTVLGMGRGSGNARTEYLAIEFETNLNRNMNHATLLNLIDKYFRPMQQQYGWGPNPYYYMAGKHGIHPTYIQEMMDNTRYKDEDILAVIGHLKLEGGKHYSLNTMEASRNFYSGVPRGTWRPADIMKNRDALVIGTGASVASHRRAIEQYIRQARPFVIALNTQNQIEPELIDVRIACHPVRLLADCKEHTRLPQPLITPASMLPADVRDSLQGKELFDFGLTVQTDVFEYHDTYCVVPNSLVFAYALAVATSGKAGRILLAGFDGYNSDDHRAVEMETLLTAYRSSESSLDLISITPTRYKLKIHSVYSL